MVQEVVEAGRWRVVSLPEVWGFLLRETPERKEAVEGKGTGMRLTMWREDESNEQVYQLRIPAHEQMTAKFHDFDRLLLADCDRSAKVSDTLLGLEVIARRIEEAS